MADRKAPSTEGVDNRLKSHTSRRDFFKKAIISTVAVTATAGVAKKAADLLPDGDLQKKYLHDVQGGDSEILKREYVVMSKAEKEDLIRSFESADKA